MTRVEYMRELEALLSDIPAEEREDAINYYNDYFDAGGEENEDNTIISLGTPEELAKTIKLASRDQAVVDGEFTETGFHDGTDYGNNALDKYTRIDNQAEAPGKAKKELSAGMLILIVVLALFACPILLPIVIVILAAMFAIGVSIFAVVLALVISIVAVGAAGLWLGFVGIGTGIANIITAPFQAMMLIGGSLIALSIGILLVVGCICVIRMVVPPVFRFVVGIFTKPVAWIKKKHAERQAKKEGMRDE